MNKSVFDPARIIEGAISTLFGPEHAVRWPGCVAAVQAAIPPGEGEAWSWQQMASAVIVWLACVQENEQLLDGVASVALAEVHVVGSDGACTMSPAVAANDPQLTFLKLHPAGALMDALTVPARAASVVSVTMREDSAGRGAIEIGYAINGKTIVATYGDPPAAAHLTTYRVLRGDVLLAMHRALWAAIDALNPERAPPPATVCVGATGPVLIAANENGDAAA